MKYVYINRSNIPYLRNVPHLEEAVQRPDSSDAWPCQANHDTGCNYGANTERPFFQGLPTGQCQGSNLVPANVLAQVQTKKGSQVALLSKKFMHGNAKNVIKVNLQK